MADANGASARSPTAPAPPAGVPGLPWDKIGAVATLVAKYMGEVGLHTRKAQAATERDDPSAAATHQRQADYWYQRACILVANVPMPAHLRTPTEGIQRVDGFRSALADLLVTFSDVTLDEWRGFEGALSGGKPDEVQARLEQLRAISEAFGIEWTEQGEVRMRPLRLPTDGIRAPPPAAPPPPPATE